VSTVAEYRFRIGDRVRAVVESAEVRHHGPSDSGLVRVEFHADGRVHFLDLPADTVEIIERATPNEWPPQLGDLWRGGGQLWFAMVNEVSDGVPVILVGAVEGGQYPDDVLGQHALTLVRREQQDGGESRD
jgi:hypothetical protein